MPVRSLYRCSFTSRHISAKSSRPQRHSEDRLRRRPRNSNECNVECQQHACSSEDVHLHQVARKISSLCIEERGPEMVRSDAHYETYAL
jgi:hypothetical protein